MSVMKQWTVMECPKCKARSYFYVSEEEIPEVISKFEQAGYSNEDMECYRCEEELVEVPYEDWSAEDVAEIFGNELENKNYHSFVEMPATLLRSLKKTNIEQEKCSEVMKKFVEEITRSWR